MNKDSIKLYFHNLLYTISSELRAVFLDEGVFLIVILAPIIYATIYSSVYGTQVLRDVPVGVVDMSKTPTSRQLTQMIDLGPNTKVAYTPTDMEDARQLFFDKKIYSILYIPSSFERDLLGGDGTNVALYLDASYMLMYRQAFEEMAASISTFGAEVEYSDLIAQGADTPQALELTQPVIYQSHTLFNPYIGYGTFIMPPVIMLILQQTLLIGIGMLSGTRRERATLLSSLSSHSPFLTLFVRVVVYFSIYAILLYYLLNVHYKAFNYPINGAISTIVIFLAIYLIACILFALAASSLFHRRESPLMLFLWTSIPLLMLSGVSYPHQAIPEWMRLFSYIFPSTFGAGGFVKIATNGASLNEVLPEIKSLAILIIIYLYASYFSIDSPSKKHHIISEEKRKPPTLLHRPPNAPPKPNMI